jgi:hypothetical protein
VSRVHPRYLAQAVKRINGSPAPGPTTIKVAPAGYYLDRPVVIEKGPNYTEQDRLPLKAAVVPDDPNWSPALMPVLLSVEDARHYSGYGVDSGATGPTDPEITYEEHNVIRQGRVILETDQRSQSCLYVASDTLGSHLGAGRFRPKP